MGLYFLRSLALTLSVVILVITVALAFELINENISKSGFSSGEVLTAKYEDGMIFGEIMGKSFSADTNFLKVAFLKTEKLAVFLPPDIQFFIRILLCCRQK